MPCSDVEPEISEDRELTNLGPRKNTENCRIFDLHTGRRKELTACSADFSDVRCIFVRILPREAARKKSIAFDFFASRGEILNVCGRRALLA